MRHLVSAALLVMTATVGRADPPVVEGVTLHPTGNSWRVDVTLRHGDTGWDHYADGWEVVDAQGRRLGYRKLLHPHVNEQPFTRSLGGVEIPEDVSTVFVRPHCNTTGWGTAQQPTKVPR